MPPSERIPFEGVLNCWNDDHDLPDLLLSISRSGKTGRLQFSNPEGDKTLYMKEGKIVRGDPWDTAGIFVGTLTGIVLLSMGGSQTVFSQASLERLVKMAIRTFWRGLDVGLPPSPATVPEG